VLTASGRKSASPVAARRRAEQRLPTLTPYIDIEGRLFSRPSILAIRKKRDGSSRIHKTKTEGTADIREHRASAFVVGPGYANT
jgi:hypothetical protein